MKIYKFIFEKESVLFLIFVKQNKKLMENILKIKKKINGFIFY